MLGKKERDGRHALSMREWTAIRVLHAAISALTKDGGALKERLQTETERGWTQLRTAQGLLQKLDDQILATIPMRQKQAIYTELQHTYMHVNVEMGSVSKSEGVIYVNEEAMKRLVDHAISMECFSCSKTCKEAKRCRLFRDIQGVFHYSIDGEPGEDCVFAGLTELPRGDGHDHSDQENNQSQNDNQEGGEAKGKHAKGR